MGKWDCSFSGASPDLLTVWTEHRGNNTGPARSKALPSPPACGLVAVNCIKHLEGISVHKVGEGWVI